MVQVGLLTSNMRSESVADDVDRGGREVAGSRHIVEEISCLEAHQPRVTNRL